MKIIYNFKQKIFLFLFLLILTLNILGILFLFGIAGHFGNPFIFFFAIGYFVFIVICLVNYIRALFSDTHFKVLKTFFICMIIFILLFVASFFVLQSI